MPRIYHYSDWEEGAQEPPQTPIRDALDSIASCFEDNPLRHTVEAAAQMEIMQELRESSEQVAAKAWFTTAGSNYKKGIWLTI